MWLCNVVCKVNMQRCLENVPNGGVNARHTWNALICAALKSACMVFTALWSWFATEVHVASFNGLWGHSWLLLDSNGSPAELGPGPLAFTRPLKCSHPARAGLLQGDGVCPGCSPLQRLPWFSVAWRYTWLLVSQIKTCSLRDLPLLFILRSSSRNVKKGIISGPYWK